MSSRRSIVWLLFFVLLAVSAHVLVTVRSGRSVVTARSNLLLPGSDRATFLEVARPGQPAATVARSGRWRLTAPFAASVDADAVLRVLDALAFTPVTDVLSVPEMRRLGRTLNNFGLDAPVLRLAVRRDDEEKSVSFGARTPAGDGVYAAVSDRPGVCVVASNVFAALDVSLDGLRNPQLLADACESVTAIDVRRSAGHFVRVSRQASGTWQMEDAARTPVSAARVDAFVKLLASARSRHFVWPAAGEPAAETPSVSLLASYGLDAESVVSVSLVGSDGRLHGVSFGKNADGDSVYALVQDGGAIATVSSALRDRLLAEADAFVDLKLFPCEEKSIATLSIVDGDTTYLLARSPEGDWRIDSPVAAPADQEVVHSLLQTILSLHSTERDRQGLVVSVSSNLPPVAVARDALLVQNRFEDLRAKTILKMPADRIRRLSVTAADGRHESAVWDAANRTWLLGKTRGTQLNGLALAGVLGALDPLTAQSIVRLRVTVAEAGNYGLEKPRFTLAVDPLDEGAVRRNILIGSPAPGGGAYATVGSTDAVFILSDETVRALTASFSSGE